MNWEAFAQVIVWAAFILSAVLAFGSVFFVLDEDLDSRGVRTVLVLAVIVAVLSLAVIGGMGWMPEIREN